MTPTLGGTISSSFLAEYDQTVQQALNSGPDVYVIVDVVSPTTCQIGVYIYSIRFVQHNYARWNGAVIGQGGPTNQQFISLWTQLAQHYANQPRAILGIMNEPHDLTVATWVQTIQQVVTAIRQTGATNYLLLPGSSYSSAQTFPTEAGPLLVQVTDPLGGTNKLIFDGLSS